MERISLLNLGLFFISITLVNSVNLDFAVRATAGIDRLVNCAYVELTGIETIIYQTYLCFLFLRFFFVWATMAGNLDSVGLLRIF